MNPIKKLALGGLFILFLASSSTRSFAGLHAEDFSVSSQSENQAVRVEVTPPPGNHINTQAPAKLVLDQKTSVKPRILKKEKAVFWVPGSGEAHEKILISLFLCDDKNTYCEKHDVSARWTELAGGKKAYTVTPDKPSAEIQESQKKVAGSRKYSHGFILNDSKAAFEKANREHKPLLIEFFAIWCPPCNRMDQEVFSSPEFQKATQGFVKLKLDGDLSTSWEFKSKYHPPGYPTLIFATSGGDEVHRVTDYMWKTQLVQEIAQAQTLIQKGIDQGKGFAVLKLRAEKGDRESSDQLGLFFLDREAYADAKRFLTGTSRYLDKLATAEIGYWEVQKKAKDPDAVSNLIQILDSSSNRFSDIWAFAVDGRDRLAEIYEEIEKPEQQKATLRDLVSAALRLIPQKQLLEAQSISFGDAWSELAETQEKLGNSSEAKKAWLEASSAYLKAAKSDSDRANPSSAAYCLGKAGRVNQAKAIFHRLQHYYPNEFTYYYKEANLYNELKMYSDAKQAALNALSRSYGDNRLKTIQTLVTAHRGLAENQEALALVRDSLRVLGEMPKDPTIATSRHIEKLKKLEKELQ